MRRLPAPNSIRINKGVSNVELHATSDAILPPDSKLLTLDVTLNRNAAVSAIDGALLAIDMTQIHALTAARLHVYDAQYSGEQSFYNFALSSDQVLTLLKGHTERCIGLGKDASHRNGCGGLAVLQRQNDRLARDLDERLRGVK